MVEANLGKSVVDGTLPVVTEGGVPFFLQGNPGRRGGDTEKAKHTKMSTSLLSMQPLALAPKSSPEGIGS